MTPNRFTRALTAAFAGCLLLANAATAQTQPKQALDLATVDTEVVVYVPSLSALSEKVAKMNRDLGLQRPELQNVLAVTKSQMGAIAGVNDAGPMVVAISDLKGMMEDQSDTPPMVMLLPVSDYAAFLGNYGVNETGGVQEMTFPSGEAAFVKELDGFAVLSPQKEKVEAYVPAKQGETWSKLVGGVNQTDLAKSDIVLLANLERLRPMLREGLTKARKQMQAQMANDPQAEMVKPIMALYFDAFDTIVRDGQAGMSTLALGDAGVGLTYNFQFTAGSPTAKLMGNGQNNSSAALAMLPSQNYIMSYAMDFSGLDQQAIIDAVLKAMPAAEEAGDMAPLINMYKQSLPTMKNMTGASWAWYAGDPQAMMQPGNFFKSVTVYQTDDPKALIASTKEAFEAMNKMKMPGNGQEMAFTTTYTPNALQMEGVSVDQFQVQMQMPPEVMQQMGPMAAMMSNTSGFVASKGNNVVVTTSIDTQLLASALRGLDGGGLGTNDTIAGLRGAGIAEAPTAQAYISLQGIAQTADPFLMMFGGGQPINVPADVPPIAITTDIQDAGFNYKLFLPTTTVKFITDTSMRITQQMQQGGGGGQPQPAPF